MVHSQGTRAEETEQAQQGSVTHPPARERAHSGEGHWIAKMRQVPEALGRANETFVRFVREQPLVALGAACAVGYVLGRALRRVV